MLLLLAKILSRVYGEKNRPKYNVMFILSGGGKLNYLGSKNWIEQQMEKSNTLQVNMFYSLMPWFLNGVDCRGSTIG